MGDVYQRQAPGAAAAPPAPLGDVYQRQAPGAAATPKPAPLGDVYQRQAPGAAPPAPAGDVYQGPAPTGDVYQGDVYQGQAPAGDVYQGDVYQGQAPTGDVYQGDVVQGPSHQGTSSDSPVTVTLKKGAEEDGSTGRAILFGALAGGVSAMLWYGAVIVTQYQFGFLAIGIGWLVGVATTAGAGRGGSQTALLSVAIAAVSMIGADYMINDHYYRKFTGQQIQAEEAFSDGHISDDDIALYLDTSIGELHAELSDEELEQLREFIRLEAASDPDEDWDEPEEPAHLPLSELPYWMGWWEYVFIFIGASAAFQVPMGAETE